MHEFQIFDYKKIVNNHGLACVLVCEVKMPLTFFLYLVFYVFQKNPVRSQNFKLATIRKKHDDDCLCAT